MKKPLHKIIEIRVFVKFKSRAIFEYLQTIRRLFKYNDNRFEKLKQLKDKYKGKRCFITCTGPSLSIKDLELLKNEYVFGMNSICLIHDKTDWQPDFFAIQDSYVFEKVYPTLINTDNGLVFVPIEFRKQYKIPDNWIYFHISGSYHLYEMAYRRGYFAYFSDDCYQTVYDGYSVTYSIIQLAIYMGFNEIYLLGADCNYFGPKQHFIEHGHYDPSVGEAPARMFAAYGKAKEFADNHNIKIINATRGGCLELFPRKPLEDVLANNERNKLS